MWDINNIILLTPYGLQIIFDTVKWPRYNLQVT